LASFREENIDFKWLWLYALGKAPDLKMRQFLATLYGVMYIGDFEKSGPSLPCFYFSFNEFYRSSEIIDGAIISTRQEAKLCLNNFSTRYMALKNSVLYRKFQGGICDPERLESEGKAYIADCDLDRSNKKAVLKYIQNKYNKKKLLDIEMKHHSVELSLKRD